MDVGASPRIPEGSLEPRQPAWLKPLRVIPYLSYLEYQTLSSRSPVDLPARWHYMSDDVCLLQGDESSLRHQLS